MAAPFLSTNGLCYRYATGGFSIENVDLVLPPQTTTGIIGKNGSGKSTILRLLGGHLPASSGKIFIEEQEITPLSSGERPIATVFQTLALFPHLSVRENIIFPIKYGTTRLPPGTTPKNRTDELLQLLDLNELADRPSTALSLGQQQKVAIARALATGARLLLLDEPTASLDFSTKDQLIEIIQKIRQEGIVDAIALVSHDRDFLLATCQHMALVENGSIHQQGWVEALKKAPPSPEMAEALAVPYLPS